MPRKKIEERAINTLPTAWTQFTLGNQLIGSVVVNEDTALQCSSVWNAISLLAQDLSSLPIQVYQRNGEGREKATNHPVYTLLHDRPNDYYTSIKTLKYVLWRSVFTCGNGYLLIERNGGGRPLGLVNIGADRVSVTVNANGSYVYKIDNKEIVTPADMIHVRFDSEDGLCGISPLKIGQTVIAIAIAMDQFASSYFSNGARPSGILISDTPLSDQARENLKKSWDSAYSGASKVGKTPVLELGLKYQQLSIPNEQSQFAEVKQSVITQIAQLYNLPPHKLKDLGRATWGNLSSENIAYVQSSLRVWALQLEEELQLKLFSPKETDYYVEHCFQDLLRADDLTRAQVYSIGLQQGYYTIEEVRQWENLPPLPQQDQPQEVPSEATLPLS